MNFQLNEAIEILERTPKTLDSWLVDLSDGWVTCREGEETWNAYEVIGHLIEGEKHDWIPRLELILLKGGKETFPPFDVFAHMKEEKKQTIKDKLAEFTQLRSTNITRLKELVDANSDFQLTGQHPVLGTVTAHQLLSTWVVHDLTHISQIVRVMAERYRDDVGPWKAFLGILKNN
ncbi:DinB family protein [Bacillus sp. JCM 19034]|uniref:DinB family protein n=1 Tax=Bacillus sp. JCM 19034 TaxID=1481928 RepID=UPI00078543BB|nr:DinB family protein [Bacillus sp. JCM 19034]